MQDDFETFDARALIGAPDRSWHVSLIGVNVTNEIFTNTSGPRPFVPPGGDDRVVSQNHGRQIFIETSFRF